MKKRILFLLTLGLLFSGCATLRSKSVYSIPISTTPEKAMIIVTDRKGKEIISTQSPDTLMLKASEKYFKRAEYLVEVSHDGYQTKKEAFFFIMDGKYLQNVFLTFFMPIGFLLIDPISGAMWMPEKQKIKVILNPEFPR
jgi:hypothetical protein